MEVRPGVTLATMKTLCTALSISALMASFVLADTNPAAATAEAPAAPDVATTAVPLELKDFVGTWKVKDGRENVFFITLKDDGTASSKWEAADLSDRAESGQWTLRKGEAMVTWPNGWREIISFDGKGYSKRAYGSTHKLDGKPSNVSGAEKVAATP
jgi:hypothetical protein